MDRKQKLLADVDAEANAKRQAIESNTQRIAQTDELCERINNAQPSVFKAVVTVSTPIKSPSAVVPNIRCTVITHHLSLEQTLAAIIRAGLQTINVALTYPEEPRAPWRHSRSIAVDGFPGIFVECELSEHEQLVAACA